MADFRARGGRHVSALYGKHLLSGVRWRQSYRHAAYATSLAATMLSAMIRFGDLVVPYLGDHLMDEEMKNLRTDGSP